MLTALGLLAHLGEHLVGGGVAEPRRRRRRISSRCGVSRLPLLAQPLGEVAHGPVPLTAAAAGPRGAAAAPGPSRPCRRRRAGRPRRTRRAACRRSSPWRCAVRATASVTISKRGWSAWSSPCQISTKPVLWVITTSRVPSSWRPDEAGLLGGLADHVPSSSLDPGPAHVVDERAAVLLEEQLLAELEPLDRGVVALAVARARCRCIQASGAQFGVDVVGDLERHGAESRAVASGMRRLLVKVTCGAEDPERCNQAFTVAATAAASGRGRRAVADRRGGVVRGARQGGGVLAAAGDAARRPAGHRARRPGR